LTTSLILSSDELHGIVEFQGENISEHLCSLIKEICPDDLGNVNIVSSLQEKQLAGWDGQTLTLEPFLKLIINEACNALSLFKPTDDTYALECPDMYLLFSRYKWAENMWKIAPFKDKISLQESFT